jgi:hypothetical protein
MPLHADASGDELHPPCFATYANAADRASGTQAIGGSASLSGNVGCWAKQNDSGAIYELTNHSPITWVLVSDPGAVVAAAAAQADATSALANAATAQATANAKLSPGGTLTGAVAAAATIDGAAASMVRANAAAGATAIQPNTSPTLAGLTLTGFGGFLRAAAGGLLSASALAVADIANDLITKAKLAPAVQATLDAVIDSTTAAKGLIQLAGDLGGTAAAPLVLKSNGNVLPATAGGGDVGKQLYVSAAGVIALGQRGTQFIQFAGTTLGSQLAAQRWLVPYGSGLAPNAVDNFSNRFRVSRPGKLKYLVGQHLSGGITVSTVVVTVQIDGIDTTITCTNATENSSVAYDTTHEVSIAANSEIGIAFNRAGGSTPTAPRYLIGYTPDP